MPKDIKRVRCPACAYEFAPHSGADLLRLVCPHCEAPIPDEALKDRSEIAEEIAPGFRPGQRLGNYIIESLLGAGGMAVVFKGKQLSLNRYVAIKILPKNFSTNKLFLERFEGEAAVLASMNHANIVNVIDRGREGDIYFIVMEYVEGETLKDLLQRNTRLPPEKVIPLAEQFLAGLEYAHKRGVVHRDIKPGNVMINREGVVKIADFGLAHLAKQQGGLDITRDNQAMGTLKYMAPEQLVSARAVDARADLYSFGTCLYEMLTGTLPLGMFKMPSECDSSLDIRWDEIILRSLKMDPAERYASAEEIARDVRQIATSPKVTRLDKEREEAAETIGADEQTTVKVSMACARCGVENPPEAEKCMCGASLDDILDRCPSCRKKNRIDMPTCRACGADLTAHREEKRRAAEQIQLNARQFCDKPDYDAALAELNKLMKFTTREYAPIRKQAQKWIARTQERRDRFRQREYEAGLRLIAEGRYDRALQMLQSLPDDYKDVAQRRSEASARRREALEAKAEGTRLYKQGDLAGAVAAWEKAARYLPQDTHLRKELARARITLGNLSLKRTYLKESQEAAARGNLTEAVALCRKVLDIAPNDATALSLLGEYERRERRQVDVTAASQPEIALPQVTRGRRHAFPWGKVATILILVACVAIAIVLGTTAARNARARKIYEAGQLFVEARTLREEGKLDESDDKLSRLVKQYPGTPSAQPAADLRKEISDLRIAAGAACKKADDLAAKGDDASLKAAFKEYRRLLAGPPVTFFNSFTAYATSRLESVRDKIERNFNEAAAAREARNEWHEALAVYTEAAQEYGAKGEKTLAGLANARKMADEFDRLMKTGRDASSAGRWDEAFRAASAALDIMPLNQAAIGLLAAAASHTPPPEGMALIPRGTYKVGGVAGTPAREFSLPYGIYVDRTEVTRANYARFLNSTGRQVPPGWGTDAPQPGTESLPATGVTFEDAAAYAQWARKRLPTEEEWECAARGEDGLRYPWGAEWKTGAAVLAYGPAPVGAASGDRSPFGAADMLGNVAEWTSTPAAPPTTDAATGNADRRPPLPGARTPGATGLRQDRPGATSQALYVVKGSSWAGGESGRPATVVAVAEPANPMTAAQAASAKVLTSNSAAPVRYLLFPSSIEISYLNSPTPDFARISIRKWLPEYEDWAECRTQFAPGAALNGSAAVLVEETGARTRRVVQVDIATGCTLLRFESKWLELRDPAGIIRRIDITPNIPPQPTRALTRVQDAPAGETSIETAAACAARMLGRSGEGYLNVGFRCVKPVWEPKPKPAAAP